MFTDGEKGQDLAIHYPLSDWSTYCYILLCSQLQPNVGQVEVSHQPDRRVLQTGQKQADLIPGKLLKHQGNSVNCKGCIYKDCFV